MSDSTARATAPNGDQDRVTDSAASPVDHLCGWMGCKHAEAWHGEDGCIVPVMDYATVHYNAAGEKLPPQERPCGCTWVEPCAAKPRPIKDRPQA